MHEQQSTRSMATTARGLGWAGLAAIAGCAACCALPMIAAATLGSGAAAGIARFVGPGTELVIGGTVFVAVLGVLALRRRAERSGGCATTCSADGKCCNVRAAA